MRRRGATTRKWRQSNFKTIRPSFGSLLVTTVVLSGALFPSRSAASVQKLISLPEERIDVGLAALTFAKEVYPGIDIAAHSRAIDALADKVGRLCHREQDPDRRVRCLNTVLLLQEKYQGTRDPFTVRRPETYYLSTLLETKKGNCFSLPILYVAVAQRLSWPVYMASVPDHCFVRYHDPNFKEQNIETTSNGGFVSDEKYAADFRVSERGRRTGAYLRTLSYRETLAELAAVNAITFSQRGKTDEALVYLKTATKLNPRLAPGWDGLQLLYRGLARRSSSLKAIWYSAMADLCAMKRNALGFVHPKDVPLTSVGRSSQ